jgi:hypothetical protein
MVLGLDNIITYILALNTILNLGFFFERQANITKARIIYSKALIRSKKVFGPDYLKSRSLRDKFSALDAVIENKALVGVKVRTQEDQEQRFRLTY